MADPLETTRRLIELACDEATASEEARTAAMMAVRLIRKHKLLDGAPRMPSIPSPFSSGSNPFDEFLDQLRRDVARAQRGPYKKRPSEEPQGFQGKQGFQGPQGFQGQQDYRPSQPREPLPAKGVWFTMPGLTYQSCCSCKSVIGAQSRAYRDAAGGCWCKWHQRHPDRAYPPTYGCFERSPDRINNGSCSGPCRKLIEPKEFVYMGERGEIWCSDCCGVTQAMARDATRNPHWWTQAGHDPP